MNDWKARKKERVTKKAKTGKGNEGGEKELESLRRRKQRKREGEDRLCSGGT